MTYRVVYLFVYLLCLSFSSLEAQQESQFTQFAYNQQYYNPAYVGIKKAPELYSLFRQQWQGYPGAPQSVLLGINGPLLGDRAGLGLLMSRQTVGISKSWGARLSYAYEVALGEQRMLRLGIQGSMRQLAIDFSEESVLPLEGNDPVILTGMQRTHYLSNWGSGLYYMDSRFYLGFSIPNIRANEIRIGRRDGQMEVAREARHFYYLAGFSWRWSEKVEAQPVLLLKSVKNSPWSLDINFRLAYQEKIIAGISYRYGADQMGESIGINWRYTIRSLEVGIAYDFLLSPLTNSANGSIELLSRYTFASKQNAPIPLKISRLF